MVRGLEHRHRRGLQGLLTGLLDVAGEQHGHLSVPHPQHQAGVVHPVQHQPIPRRPEDLDDRLAELEGGVTDLHLLGARITRRAADGGREPTLRGPRGQPEPTGGDLLQHRHHPQRMVGMRMGERRQLQLANAS